MKLIILILAAIVALSACGKKTPLKTPPAAEASPEISLETPIPG